MAMMTKAELVEAAYEMTGGSVEDLPAPPLAQSRDRRVFRLEAVDIAVRQERPEQLVDAAAFLQPNPLRYQGF